MAAEYIFIRHAESANNHLAATGFPRKEDRPAFLKVRKPNPELTADGRGQTALVARRIVEEYYSQTPSAPSVPSSSSSPFVPRPVAEIWCSYLTRAIETAVAIQDAIRGAATSGGVAVPPIRLDADATEVGGHYEYDSATDRQVGTPGFTNADVRARWPDASFVFPQEENEAAGWNKSTVQETHEAAAVRAERFVRRMESVAVGAGASSAASSSPPPLFIVITHGDYFRSLLHAIANDDVTDGLPIGAHTNVAKRRSCDAAIAARAAVKQNIGNTSLSHFAIIVSDRSADAVAAASPTTAATSDVAHSFAWSSAFMADNAHVNADASQAAAVARFESKGKDDFEDTATK